MTRPRVSPEERAPEVDYRRSLGVDMEDKKSRCQGVWWVMQWIGNHPGRWQELEWKGRLWGRYQGVQWAEVARKSAHGREEERERWHESKGRGSRGTPGAVASGPTPSLLLRTVRRSGQDLAEPFQRSPHAPRPLSSPGLQTVATPSKVLSITPTNF